MNDHRKRKVLFLCTGNSARSILAEYLLRDMDASFKTSRFQTYSAGAEPTGKVHPMATHVLREAYGIDAGGASSKSWDALANVDLDIVITVCDHARDTCPVLPGISAVQAHWGSPDPAKASDSEAETQFRRETEAAFRRVATEIHHRLEQFCALPWQDLNSAELAEQLRRIGETSPSSRT